MRANLRRTFGTIAVAAAVPTVLIGCASSEPTVTAESSTSSSNPAVNAGAEVEATSIAGKFTYEPGEQTIKVGEAVTWTNTDTTKHTVTADKDQIVDFKSPTMAPETQFVQTFAQAGDFAYYCSIHGREKMSGVIHVTE